MVRQTLATALHICVNSFAVTVVVSPKPSVVFPMCSCVICVDSENKSVVLSEGFFSDEQTTSFAYVRLENILSPLNFVVSTLR